MKRRRVCAGTLREISNSRHSTAIFSPSLNRAKPPPLTLRELESIERMAVCVRMGLPEHAHLVTAKIGCFVAANGDQLAGPSREVFLQPPDVDRMHEAVVEMQFPIQAARP